MHNTDKQIDQSYNINDSVIRNTAGTLICQSKNIKGGSVSGSAIQNTST